MTTPLEPELTDELLSAYIDNAVTPEERHMVEQAAADDSDVAWRLQSLQMTVHLLHELPALALPRSFALTPEQIGEPAIGSLAAQPAPTAPSPRRAVQPAQPGFWARLGEGWRIFWQSGSPALRNAMATSLVLLFVVLAAPRFMTGPESESFESVVVAPAAAPMAELARESAPPPRATVMLRNAAAADAARLAAPATDAALEQPVTTGSEAPVATAVSVESADTPPAVTKMAAPESASAPASDGAAAVVAAAKSTSAAAPAAGSGEDAAVAAAAMPAAEAAPPTAAETAPLALGAVSAGPILDQSPEQDADLLSAARAVAPAAESTGGGPAMQESAAPAMAAPAGAAAPLPAATSTSTQTPTAAPTATPTAIPTVMPATTAPIAPTAASVAVEQRAEDTLVLPPEAAQPNSSPAAALPWLAIAQLVAGASFLLFGLLWWRSRR